MELQLRKTLTFNSIALNSSLIISTITISIWDIHMYDKVDWTPTVLDDGWIHFQLNLVVNDQLCFVLDLFK